MCVTGQASEVYRMNTSPSTLSIVAADTLEILGLSLTREIKIVKLQYLTI